MADTLTNPISPTKAMGPAVTGTVLRPTTTPSSNQQAILRYTASDNALPVLPIGQPLGAARRV